ncbi:DegT/DnrJ/EryC1/StrS family aminotransferase [Vibrio sp. Of7-15]|uniref:DegT/DnrJ/EryC1/StrS family aminotransferase n=1 Tax=Vibrio sp. Of7-15 TaxID=2724879 RepID=UPI001EF175F6|nr:DegT/DnrJ/EryC1/StrS family aminotransferase [Vibrio sp. Of7-15]MCG7495334.1 DegT/DnrJ/EryC1/StrS family aminotransferase [Vibrio sp. Of7-15]
MRRVQLNVAYWGWKEFIFSCYIHIISSGIKGKHINELESFIKSNFGLDNVYLLNSARAGIYQSLLVMKKIKTDKNEVILPKYICPSVIEVITRAELKPIMADIREDLTIDPESIESLISEKTLAILMPHMYGKVSKINKIVQLSKQNDTFLIDDAAQLVGEFHQKQLVGTFGDVGVVSFSQSKTLVTGVRASGGFLICNNDKINNYLMKQYEGVPYSESRKSPFLHFVMTCLFKRYLGTIDYYLSRIKTKLGLPRKDYYKSITRISNVDAKIALIQFKKIDDIKKSNKKSLKEYQEHLHCLDSIHIPQLSSGVNFLTRLIIRTHKITPEELSQFLNENGIETRKAYMNGSQPFTGHPESGLLELPLVGLNEADVQYVASVLQRAESTLLKDKPWQIIQPS